MRRPFRRPTDAAADIQRVMHFPEARPHRVGSTILRPGIWFVLTVVVASAVLFYRLGDLPIQVWDEARLANNALEMSQSGLSLVTTYDGQPDHWNTKPPLLIWAMALSIRVFGPTEWAVRFPSAVAALVTAMIVFAFCVSKTGRPWAAFVAVLVMLGSPGYVQGTDFWTNPGELLQGHAARSGNYEATLALFTTIYLLAAFEFISGKSSSGPRWLLLCTSGIVLAFLTKTVQGLLFLPALVMFAAAKGQIRRLVSSTAVWTAVLGASVVAVGYYIAREYLDPGYMRSALTYDFGRFRAVSDGHHGEWFYYLAQSRLFPTLVPFLMIGILQALADRGERRELSAYVALVSATYIAVLSFSATKLWWYAIPLVPLSAIAVALALDMVADRASKRGNLRTAGKESAVLWILCAAVGSLVVFRSMQLDEMGTVTAQSRPEDSYSYFLRGPVAAAPDIRNVVVLHPGYSRDVYYVAPTLFYANVLRSQGRSVLIQHPEKPLPTGVDTVIVCSGDIGRSSLDRKRLVLVLQADACAAYRVT